MLVRPDRLPRGDYGYEVKWDGFRAIVSTENGLEVRRRRGWEMGERLPELAGLPDGLVLDGELVAFGADGRPSFPERRALLEALDLEGPAWRTPPVFDDGEALLQATGIHCLEGVVAKRRSEPYRPGERGSVKVKHRDYWRFGQDLELARRRRF